jgi:hypothetical protein
MISLPFFWFCCSYSGQLKPSLWHCVLRAMSQRARAKLMDIGYFDILTTLLQYDVPWECDGGVSKYGILFIYSHQYYCLSDDIE